MSSQQDESGQPSGTAPAEILPPTSRREEDAARKDRTLAEFMLMLDEYEPLVS